jgi:hypothetical protein
LIEPPKGLLIIASLSSSIGIAIWHLFLVQKKLAEIAWKTINIKYYDRPNPIYYNSLTKLSKPKQNAIGKACPISQSQWWLT